jgi:hypothetical protein
MTFDEGVNELTTMMEDQEPQDAIDRLVNSFPESERQNLLRLAQAEFDRRKRGVPLEDANE